MTKPQFDRAYKLARSNANLTHVDQSHLEGFALPDFKPTFTTIEAVAALMRWQAYIWNGTWDSVALDEIRVYGRRLFLLSE
jgi:hypothetical protein